MKKLGILIVMLIGMTAFSQNKNARATMEVDGVCNMCKERIEKTCIKTKGVKSAVWNVDTHELVLFYDENKTDLNTIENNIASVGHDTKNVIATDEAYNSVHNCCRYREESVVEDHKEN